MVQHKQSNKTCKANRTDAFSFLSSFLFSILPHLPSFLLFLSFVERGLCFGVYSHLSFLDALGHFCEPMLRQFILLKTKKQTNKKPQTRASHLKLSAHWCPVKNPFLSSLYLVLLCTQPLLNTFVPVPSFMQHHAHWPELKLCQVY